MTENDAIRRADNLKRAFVEHDIPWPGAPQRSVAMTRREADLVRRLREIDKIVWMPTLKGTSAYTHFQRDFDQIRELTAPWHESKTDG
jgi:hypothetical protein